MSGSDAPGLRARIAPAVRSCRTSYPDDRGSRDLERLINCRRSNPAKLARAILQVVGADDPPMRTPLGSDTTRRIEAKNAFVAAELARWHDLAISTDAKD